ncbi:Hypp4231 [Branchiostoma lanceolatum]|uniref:Hypp4231 protein n=1 Tax=Branchiostoma lanceolatum TaxID=7740 RepID=A0A8K0A8C2_BRALA|nr:Hypp4231 [Branchiostoma lanceolatum]
MPGHMNRSKAGKKIPLALFGLGRAGNIHAGNIERNPHCQLKYLVDEDVERCNRFVEEFMSEAIVVKASEADIVYNDPDIQGIVVASPTFTHPDICLKALKAGKDVLCEKPIAADMKTTALVYDEAEKQGRILLCAFNRRFDPALLNLEERVKKGEVGQIHRFKTSSRDSPLPSIEYLRISGGIFHDCAVHDIDECLWIMKELPTQVHTMAHCFTPAIAELDDVDTVSITMKFSSGAIASLDLSRLSTYGYDQRTEVYGSKGMLMNHNTSPTGLHHSNSNGETAQPMYYSFPQRYAASYRGELVHFLNLIQGLEEPCIVKKDTLLSSHIAEACEESHRTGQAVSLSYDHLMTSPSAHEKGAVTEAGSVPMDQDTKAAATA